MILIIPGGIVTGLLLVGVLFFVVANMPPSKGDVRTGPDHDRWASNFDGFDHHPGTRHGN
jgi:hypothetical protein